MLINYAISDQEHPLMQLKRLGNLMFATGSAIFNGHDEWFW